VLDADEITNTTLTQLERAKAQAKLGSKTMPVIFTPQGVASAFTHGLMTAFNGKMVLEGASPLGDKLGKQVFDKRLSLADDATLAYRPTSRPCDDEGVASRRIPLIDKGRVSSFLYDLKTAVRARTESTGSGVRGGGLPNPSPSAIVIEGGDVSFEDMVADIKEGLIVEYLMGAGQGNVLGGDFSGNVLLGYKIEDGKIAGRVKDTMVSGNIYKTLKEVAAIGGDSRWVGGGLNTPSIYCPALAVASK
jgi:PmbA protein